MKFRIEGCNQEVRSQSRMEHKLSRANLYDFAQSQKTDPQQLLKLQ
jgi:hypothetical protein